MEDIARNRLRRTWLTGAASALVLSAFSASAYAQSAADQADQDQDQAEEVEQLVVTGSRIRRSESSQTIDLTILDAEEIANRGFINAIEGLEQTPLVSVGTNNFGPNTQRGDNTAFTNLLGLGTQRTLALVNGRRFVSSNQGTVFVPNNATGAQVDLTIINPALIERTETLTVGGGSVYGADAVAGVVNVILKDDFEGIDITAQGGVTQFGDGGQYRVSAAWGKNFLDGRANLTLAAEYLNSDLVRNGGPRPFTADQIAVQTNPLSLAADDAVPDTLFVTGANNPTDPAGGALFFGSPAAGSFFGQLTGAAGGLIFPNSTAQTSLDADFNNFVAATGLTPFEFATTPAGQNINQLAFLGTFGDSGSFLTVPNPDAATAAFLPRVAVPFTFDNLGNPVAFNVGDLVPGAIDAFDNTSNVTDQTTFTGGDGFNVPEQGNLRSGQERASGNALWRFDITDNITYKGDLMVSDIVNVSADAAPDNDLVSAPSAGALSVPIFIDENPFVTPATLNLLNDIAAQNTAVTGAPFFNTIDGSRVAFLGRTFFDLNGGLDATERSNSTTIRTTHALNGEFTKFKRNFYWDVAFGWGRNRSEEIGDIDLLDIEFALATDVVTDASGNIVCRQQTLAAPEAINIRNPSLTNINTEAAGGLVPTQAQVDSCVPLNAFGEGNIDPAAIDFVTATNDSINLSEQFFGTISLSGDLVDLPAGPVGFNTQFEWRREELDFIINDVFDLGLGRTTTGNPSFGSRRFFEGGFEFLAPIFGEGFRPLPFGFNSLEIDGAVRVVNRTAEGNDPLDISQVIEVPGVTDVTFTAGGRYSPVEGITFRGLRSRSVRSPSIVELLGAAQTGFSMQSANFACNLFFRSGGTALREPNCLAFEAANGFAPGELGTAAFAPTPVQIAIPAGVVGNPALDNEVANSWSVGVVLQPEFIPGLTITSDYLDVQVDGVIALASGAFDCFDNPGFPNTEVGGVPVCTNTVLATEDPANPGQFIVPTINPITGDPTLPAALPGTPSTVQEPFTVAFLQFANLNQGSQRVRALNSVVRYNFNINEAINLFGFEEPGVDLGSVFMNGTVFYLRANDTTGVLGDFSEDVININAGEVLTPQFVTRLDLTHRIGPLTHTLQWFRTSNTVEDAQETAPEDEEADFFRPDFNTFNYNVAYQINEYLTARVVVNNLTNAQQLPQFGIPGPGAALGRNFVFAINARF